MTKPGSTCVDWSNKPLPGKYARLREAETAGLRIPQTLWLPTVGWQPLVEAFSQQFPLGQCFIVRSAQVGEDGAGHSFAGHFWSSAAVQADGLLATVEQAQAENQRILHTLGRTDPPGLMVQEYISHQVGGVLFLPWSFFTDYACLEYSSAGVQQVVEGRAEPAVLSLRDAIPSPLPLPASLAGLVPLLRQACHVLQATFPFPLDCEWAYATQENALVILQVRPQTHAVGALLPLPEKLQPALPAGDWQFTALSESLGKLSPLSFSLLQRLYADIAPLFRELGCKAKAADFLVYLPDGTVLVDVGRERQFYAPTLFGGFWRGFREPTLKGRMQAVVAREAEADSPFTYARLVELFGGWMLANALAGGHGRDIAPPVHAYELGWFGKQLPVKAEQELVPPPVPPADWQALGLQLRTLFFHELNKLKQVLARDRHLLFCSWDEYQHGDNAAAGLRQQEQALQAIYDHAACGIQRQGDGNMQSLAAQCVVTGTVFVISQPAGWHAPLPAGGILVTPYFDNRWVAAIAGLRGIIVLQGSRLSHSAIVAREYGVPYAVVSPTVLAGLTDGMLLELDTIRLHIKILAASGSGHPCTDT